MLTAVNAFGRCGRVVGASIALVVAMVGAATSSEPADVMPFGKLTCVLQGGVRFCEGSIATRVKSFDGVPLDVNVVLPADRVRKLPLIVQLGYAKGGLDAGAAWGWTPREWAENGYAVLDFSARGFGDSCGSAESRAADPEGCARGWTHLADSRYEARDVQVLAGLLADDGIVHPRKIGVWGGSYGGGLSLELATLRNRVRLEDGSYVVWRSPRRNLRMKIAAAVPTIGWSDLVYALTPNGRTLDYALTGPGDNLSPIGIMKQSLVTYQYEYFKGTGWVAPPGVDPTADLDGWYALTSAGEPYDDNPAMRAAQSEIALYHSAYYLDMSVRPAPTLISNAFTDDLFPVDEGIRYANRVFAKYRHARLAQLYGHYGHSRAWPVHTDAPLVRERMRQWFDRWLKRERVAILEGVEVLTQTCPRDLPSGGPFRAATWDELSPGEVRFVEAAAKTVLSTSGDPVVGQTVDPQSGLGSCATTPATDEPGTATYRLPPAEGDGYTLLGAPTVIADVEVGGDEPALAARLWDVAPDGASQILVARALYRPTTDGRQVFQLHPNGWHFAAGHIPKLELVGHDEHYARPSNFAWSITVSNLELRLPVHESPDGGTIKLPAEPIVP